MLYVHCPRSVLVKYISNRIGVLHLGHLVESGTTEEIFEQPVHPYTKSLISAIPHPNPPDGEEPYRREIRL